MTKIAVAAIATALVGTGLTAGCSRETTDGRPPPTAQQDPSFANPSLNTESRGLPRTTTDGRPAPEPGSSPMPAGSATLPSP